MTVIADAGGEPVTFKVIEPPLVLFKINFRIGNAELIHKVVAGRMLPENETAPRSESVAVFFEKSFVLLKSAEHPVGHKRKHIVAVHKILFGIDLFSHCALEKSVIVLCAEIGIAFGNELVVGLLPDAFFTRDIHCDFQIGKHFR